MRAATRKVACALAFAAISAVPVAPPAQASGERIEWPQTEDRHEAIDESFWRPFLAASDAFDAEGFLALQSADLVRISERTGDVYDLTRYAHEIREGFGRVLARGDTARSTEVRFLSRRQAGNVARDTGYFRSRVTRNGVTRISYTRFDFTLRCTRAGWRLVVDRDSDRTPGTDGSGPRAISEADFLAAAPLPPPPPADPAQIAVPRGTAPRIDGTIGEGEWEQAPRVERSPGT